MVLHLTCRPNRQTWGERRAESCLRPGGQPGRGVHLFSYIPHLGPEGREAGHIDHKLVWKTPILLLCHLLGRAVFIRTTPKGTEQHPGPCVVDVNIINFLLLLPLVAARPLIFTIIVGCLFSRLLQSWGRGMGVKQIKMPQSLLFLQRFRCFS